MRLDPSETMHMGTWQKTLLLQSSKRLDVALLFAQSAVLAATFLVKLCFTIVSVFGFRLPSREDDLYFLPCLAIAFLSQSSAFVLQCGFAVIHSCLSHIAQDAQSSPNMNPIWKHPEMILDAS